MFRRVYTISIFLFMASFATDAAEDVPYISFSSNRSGNFDIYMIDINGKNLRNITDNLTDAYAGVWSPDGRFLTYTSNLNGNGDIYILDIETEETRRLTKDPGIDTMSAWSPDGKWIAFASNRSGAYEIYKMDARGKQLQRLTRLPGSNTVPAWSPDSQSIVFNAFWRNEEGFRERFLYVMNADGKDVRRLIKVAAGGPSWSPDGTQILFSTTRDDADGEDTFDLFTMSPAGQNLSQLTHGPKWELDPAWSPDGEWITFEGREPRQNKTSAIYVMNISDGVPRQLTDEFSMNWAPAWVPARTAFPVQPSPALRTTRWGQLKRK